MSLLQTTAAMISMSFITVMTGFYAMNLRNGSPQPNGYQHSTKVYYAVGVHLCASISPHLRTLSSIRLRARAVQGLLS